MIIFGLGNPGKRYEGTRHNVGFSVVERMAEREGLSLKRPLLSDYAWNGPHPPSGKPLLVKPLTYMNLSGRVFPAILKRTKHNLDQIVVVLDNLDLPIGECRLKKGGSPAGHNGLKSIIQTLQTPEFLRLYIGIDRPKDRNQVKSYVLHPWDADEDPLYEESFSRAVSGLERLDETNFSVIANEVNRRRV